MTASILIQFKSTLVPPIEHPAILGSLLISPESTYGMDHANYCPRRAQVFPLELVDDLVRVY